MILPHTDIDEARRVAERVRGQVADLSAIESGLSVTVSVGIASFPRHAGDTGGIIGAADAALLAAKARGRNCVYTFPPPGSPDRRRWPLWASASRCGPACRRARPSLSPAPCTCSRPL